jgi:RNA polymerase II subunit A C-terminal domain phosphatase SSU72
MRGMKRNTPVHVINVEIRDNHEDAAVGGQIILGLANMIEQSVDIHHEMGDMLEKYLEENPNAPLTYTLSYY